jgi:hypothetical protein
MRDETAAVDWYRSCIHQKQRKASRLTIEVGLQAHDQADASALVETMECLDIAIEILEQAKAIQTGSTGELQFTPVPEDDSMDDLGHSMAPIHFPEPFVRLPREPSGRVQRPSAWLAVASRDSLRFFE